jgi:FlaA1/EpsC-like NDP-sugar epimerase
MKEPAYHSTCPRTALLTISKTRYSLKPVKNLKQSLLQKHSESEVTTLLEPFVALESDEEFWRNTSDGLAVLGTIDMFKTISLPVAIEELTVVSNSFHTKPLRRYLQSVERYNVLGLSYMIIKFTKETDIRS